MPSPTIAILGAGPAGLTAIKHLLAEGLTPTAFEQSPEIGGVWRYDETLPDGGGLAYRSLQTNTSRLMTAFSDFPFPKHLPPFMPRADVLQYLHAYADHFHLRPHIRLQTPVESVTPDGARWQITVRTPAGDRETHPFHAVIVATGFYRVPHFAPYPGKDTFQGQILHSAQYKSPDPFRGQRVIVIGSGPSGVDIASDVSGAAAFVDLTSRSGAYLIPLMVNGQPADTRANRFSQLLPRSLRNRLFKKIILNFYKAAGFTSETLPLLRLPEFDFAHSRFAPTQTLLEKILRGNVRIRPDIAQICPDGVTYTDQSHTPADALIYCTGYQLVFPFLAPDIAPVEGQYVLGLYKKVFHRTYDNLAFLGMSFVTGSAFPAVEMQARWVARVFAGKLPLPPPTTRAQEIDQFLADCARKRINPMKIQLQPYLAEIAAMLGIRPRMLKHLDLLRHLWFGPMVAAHYRLDGPGKSDKARELIRDSV